MPAAALSVTISVSSGAETWWDDEYPGLSNSNTTPALGKERHLHGWRAVPGAEGGSLLVSEVTRNGQEQVGKRRRRALSLCRNTRQHGCSIKTSDAQRPQEFDAGGWDRVCERLPGRLITGRREGPAV